MVKKMKMNTFLVSLLYVVLGVIMMFFPKTTMETICYIFAGVLILIGIVYTISYFRRNIVDSYYRYDLVYGLVTILCGVLIIVKVDLLINLIPIVMGILIFGNGIIKLQHAVDLKRVDFSGWVLCADFFTALYYDWYSADFPAGIYSRDSYNDYRYQLCLQWNYRFDYAVPDF